jgi:hypothetical protein
MIDIEKIREEFDATAEQVARRGVEKANIQKAKDLDNKCMNRRDFLAVSGMAGAAALTKCATASAAAVKPEPKFVWSELIHLGMNQWHELTMQQKWPNVKDPVIAKAIADEYNAADHVRFDESLWDCVSRKFKDTGVNQIVIDLGEAVAYPSHPELEVKGSWSPDKLRGELRRLRLMGFEPIPKLNFSTTHDIWLKDYHRMVSTPMYYQVVKDLIKDVCEIFDNPRYFHLGLDEETPNFQNGQKIAIVRQGDLWWNDILFYVKEVEKYGARAWVWSDYLRRHEPEEFVRRMPKSVVQSPWWYIGNFDPEKNLPTKAMVRLAELGYDVVPCSSNCYSHPGAMDSVVEFCRKTYDPKHVLGFQMAPWLEMNKVFKKRWFDSAEQLAASRLKWLA